MEKKPKVILVDSMFMRRSYLENFINDSESFYVAGVCSDSDDAYDVCKQNNADLVLMGAYSSRNPNTFENVKKIKSDCKNIKVIIFTDLPEISFLSMAKRVICDSFWYIEDNCKSLIELMKITQYGESCFPDDTPVEKIGCTLSSDFSNAEIGVLIKLCQSKPNKVIAEELKISVNTVKYHIKNMLVKSGYNNKYSLALDAVDKRIIIPKLKWYCNVESEPI